jgi:hypothetical protein
MMARNRDAPSERWGLTSGRACGARSAFDFRRPTPGQRRACGAQTRSESPSHLPDDFDHEHQNNGSTGRWDEEPQFFAVYVLKSAARMPKKVG